MTKKLARFLQVLGEPNRLEICRLLAGKPATVSELVDELAIAQPLVSHHVKRLRDSGLIERADPSRRTRYRLRAEIMEALSLELWLLAERSKAEARAEGRAPRRSRGTRSVR